MKWRMFWTLVLSLCLVSVGRAQVITGSGSPDRVAKFNGTTNIVNSAIVDVSGKSGIGTDTPSGKLVVFDDDTTATNGLTPTAVFGITTSSLPFSAGVRGNVDSGQAIGVIGVNNAKDGQSGGGAVEGLTFSTTGFNTAVRGTAAGTSSPSQAIFGEQFSADGNAGLFINRAGGNILTGAVSQNPDITVFRVDGTGRVFADGGFRPFGADLAESLPVKGNRAHYALGDLLVIDPSGERRLALSQTPYSTLVAGIYSTKPGIVASQHRMDDPALGNEVPLAVVGIVPCKVTTENGPIRVGDLLVTSSTPGHAMKGTDRNKMLGAVVGKALEPLREGKSVVQVLMTLQ